MVKHFFKDSLIVWHDPNVKSEENKQYFAQLERFCEVKTFIEWKEATIFIQGTKAACHVITSGTNGEFLVKEIGLSQNVLEIYIFCREKVHHLAWAKGYEKISCVKDNIEDILDEIQKNLLKWQKETSSFKNNLPAFAPIFNDWDKSGMNNLHRYLKVIPHFKNRLQATNDILTLSRAIYSDKDNMERFEKTYSGFNKEVILRWYTENSFVYRVTNNCLRIATSDSIQYCRLFLRDLEQAIKEQYQKSSKNFAGLLYRGAFLSDEEWKSLKENLNREIEMHGFLSASKDKRTASNFTKSDPNNKVFITIIIPKGPSESEQGFAEVDEFSAFSGEKEILFNVRSRFTILETEEKSKALPYRHLVLLYGAQDLRKYLTVKNPVQEILVPNFENVSCYHCHGSISETSENMLFKPISELATENFVCRICLPLQPNNFASLCIPMIENADQQIEKLKVTGLLLTYPMNVQLPMYGYKCVGCEKKKERIYFTCTECQKIWCEDCFKNDKNCKEAGHAIVLERVPFSFWFQKMSLIALKDLKTQNEVLGVSDRVRQGEMYVESNEYQKAIEYYTIYIQQNKEKKKDIDLVRAYNFLGIAYNHEAEYKKALECHFKAIEIAESIDCGPDDRDFVAICYRSIAEVKICQSEYKDAHEYLSKALESFKSIHGDSHPDIAETYNDMARAYKSQADYEKALECFSESISIFISSYGENHPKTAICYSDMAEIFISQADYEKSLKYLSKALEIFQAYYGSNHPQTASAFLDLGHVYQKQGEYQTALEYSSKALEIWKSFYGNNHPSVAKCYNNIGTIYENLAELNNALEHFSKALEIWRSFYGENHPDVAKCYVNMGYVCYKQGEGEKALEYYSKARKIFKSVYTENHPDIATCFNNMALVYRGQADYKNALKYYSKALHILKTFYGENHSDIAACFNNIAVAYHLQGEYNDALENYTKAQKIWESHYGSDHPRAANTYNNMGDICLKQANFKDALKYFSKALEVWKSAYGENHSNVAVCYDNIALVYQEQGKYKIALEHNSKALEIWKSICSENDPRLVNCRAIMTKLSKPID